MMSAGLFKINCTAKFPNLTLIGFQNFNLSKFQFLALKGEN